MSFPWFLKPDIWLHAELLDGQDELNRAASEAYSRDREQDKQIKALQSQIVDLQQQLLALEIYLSQQGILPPRPEEEVAAEDTPSGEPVVFPAPTEEIIVCPRCGKRQKGNRTSCYSCAVPFRYETE